MAKHGRYKIVRRVADGGMAEIFFATQLGRDGFQKPVILKRIHSTIYADPQFRNMFIDEAHISMSLAHSNIAQVLDLGVAAGRYFLVLELVDGWDLGRVLQRAAAAGMPLPRELGLHIAADVCRALAYAHGKTDGQHSLGIVHRDVSPHNILLSDQGEVKLTDFGIAKAMNKREHTGTGVVKGKVAFMSPEQAMGKPIDPRSDLFSLGTVLFLLMTRCRPFEGPTELETLLRVQKGDYPPPQALAPDLEPEVGEIIDRALRLDPADRYQNADDMLSDIERVLRAVFQPVGQTELKKWLTDLSAADGILPITKTSDEKAATERAGTGELDGKDVVLADSDEDVDVEAQTGLAVLDGGGNGPVRMSRQRPTHAPLPVPDDAETEQSGRSARIDFSLPVPEGEEPPGRRRKRRGSGLSILFVGALLVGAAWFAGKYARLWTDGGTAGKAGTDATAKRTETLPPADDKAAPRDEAKVAAKAKADKAEDKAVRKGEEERAREAADDGDKPVAPRRETASRRSRSSERQKSASRRVDLKHLMAPDPSLLPPTPAPAAPPTPPPSEPAPTPAPSDEP